MLLDYKNFKVEVNGDEIKIFYKDGTVMDTLSSDVEEIKKEFPNMKIKVIINEENEVNNIDIADLTKIKNQVGKEISLLIKLRDFEEKPNRRNLSYKMVFEIQGKHKYLKGIMFTSNKQELEIGSYYIVKGIIEEGDKKFIKKNEIALGKTVDYQMKVKSIKKENFTEKKVSYNIPRHELHCHTSASKNDAFITVDDIKKAFDEGKLHTVAITDHGIAFSFLEFANGLKQYKDTNKLILGVEFYAGDRREYINKLYKSIAENENEIYNLENSPFELELEDLNRAVAILKEERKKNSNIMKRKTVDEATKLNAETQYNLCVQSIGEKNEEIKELKNQNKNDELRKEVITKELEYLREQLINPSDMERDHLTVLVKSGHEPVDYHGETININLGLVALYKLITKSYLETFSAPTRNKQWGKRPVIDYNEVFSEDVRKYFVINSACAFGKHMKLAIEERWEEFDEFVKKLDGVELQPIHNNIYMVYHEDYPNIKCEADVIALHKKIHDRCKNLGVKVISASDAHVNDKEDRIKRSIFKEGYITSILRRMKQEIKADGDNDFGIDKQPYILSYDDMVEDYKKQGFTDMEIVEIYNNTKILADSCANALEYDVLPKKLFIPEFPGVDSKVEVPRIAWEFAVKKWSKDGTVEGIEPKIRTRLEEELAATASKGFEVLYYISYFLCDESRKLGYEVGSRGSAGSMVMTYCLEVGENNPMEPHYLCDNCKHVEWVETDLVGLDLPDKECPCCKSAMKGDGLNIESHNFLGYGLNKIPDIDLNFSSDIQTDIHNLFIAKYGQENVLKSGTQMYYQTDKIKKDVFTHIPNVQAKVHNEEFCPDYYADNIKTMSSTGSHPGGLLVKPNDIPMEWVSPIVYISDDQKKAERSSAYDYHSIESQLVKIDALGHGDPSTIRELELTTGFHYKDIRFNDPKMYEAIHNPSLLGITDLSQYPFPTTTIGISEMNTDFTMNLLKELKVSSFTDLIYFSGLSHGTAVYHGNVQKEKISEGMKLYEVLPVRDIIFQHLHYKYKMDPKMAFDISEDVRKGKGIKKWKNDLEQANIPEWMITCMSQIGYMFPKAHAASYILMAMRIFYYKIHYPTQFYCAILNRYGMGKNNNSNFDFEKCYSLNSYQEITNFIKELDKATDNPAKLKDNIKIIHVIWEMKLRGVKISKADFSSHPNNAIPDAKDSSNILMPLQSIKGIGEAGALKISNAYKLIGSDIFTMSREELAEYKFEDGKKAFGKKELDALFTN